MKKVLFIIVYFMFAVFSLTPESRFIPFSGKLLNNQGNAMHGLFDFQIKLYTNISTAAVFEENHVNIPVYLGNYVLNIGTGTGGVLSPLIFTKQCYIDVLVKKPSDSSYETTMNTRLLLGVVPSAMNAITFDGSYKTDTITGSSNIPTDAAVLKYAGISVEKQIILTAENGVVNSSIFGGEIVRSAKLILVGGGASGAAGITGGGRGGDIVYLNVATDSDSGITFGYNIGRGGVGGNGEAGGNTSISGIFNSDFIALGGGNNGSYGQFHLFNSTSISYGSSHYYLLCKYDGGKKGYSSFGFGGNGVDGISRRNMWVNESTTDQDGNTYSIPVYGGSEGSGGGAGYNGNGGNGGDGGGPSGGTGGNGTDGIGFGSGGGAGGFGGDTLNGPGANGAGGKGGNGCIIIRYISRNLP